MFKCAHHVYLVGPPQCRDVQKLLHHTVEVDIDDGGQHSLHDESMFHYLLILNHYGAKIQPEMNTFMSKICLTMYN